MSLNGQSDNPNTKGQTCINLVRLALEYFVTLCFYKSCVLCLIGHCQVLYIFYTLYTCNLWNSFKFYKFGFGNLLWQIFLFVSFKNFIGFFVSLDTSIAELVKEVTDSDEFLDSLRCQQGMSILYCFL